MRLKGKTAVITGAGRGIGRAIALLLGQEGANIVVCARTESEIDGVAATLDKTGQRAISFQMDVTQLDDIKRLVARTEEVFGSIDFLIPSAGGIAELSTETTHGLPPIWELSQDAWDRMISLNLTSVFLSIKAIMPHMITRGSGHIIAVASRMGRVPSTTAPGYGEAKHAVIALVKNTALQARKYGIRVNAVAPSIIDTENQRRFMTQATKGTEMPAMESAESVAKAVLYLLCDAPQSMTGQILDLFDLGQETSLGNPTCQQ